MHIRKALRAKIASILGGVILHKGVAVTVVKNKVSPAEAEELPLICIYTFSEPANDQNTQPKIYLRTPDVSIQVLLEHEDGRVLDDDLDDIAEQIERYLFADPFLDLEEVQDSNLTNTSMVIAEMGNKTLGSAILSFAVEYKDEAVVLVEDDPRVSAFTDSKTEIEINESGNTDIQADQTYEQPPPPPDPDPQDPPT